MGCLQKKIISGCQRAQEHWDEGREEKKHCSHWSRERGTLQNRTRCVFSALLLKCQTPTHPSPNNTHTTKFTLQGASALNDLKIIFLHTGNPLSPCVRVLKASWAIIGYRLYLLWLENHYHHSHPHRLACHHCCLPPQEPSRAICHHHLFFFGIIIGGVKQMWNSRLFLRLPDLCRKFRTCNSFLIHLIQE